VEFISSLLKVGRFQKLQMITEYFIQFMNRRKINNNLLCSECFKDEGLKLDSFQIGILNNQKCPNCKSINGKKLNENLIEKLIYRFFISGTVHKVEYGAAPLIKYNSYHYKKTEVDFGELLNQDVKLLEQILKIGFFHYGPRLWTLGHIEPLEDLRSLTNRNKIVERIIAGYPIKFLGVQESFYRIRKNPDFPINCDQYDSNPNPGSGRLDSEDFPVLYGSQDLEVCIHECRVTVSDELYIAKLKPTSRLKLLDLTKEVNEKFNTEFESLGIAVSMIHSAGSYSYEITKSIAKSVKKSGFDGIIYPSFFSSVRTGSSGDFVSKFKESSENISYIIPNIALFGFPVKEEKIIVQNINKLILDKVEYTISFGPAKIA
jgi:hypothetical protein